jgi:hypothetical protein
VVLSAVLGCVQQVHEDHASLQDAHRALVAKDLMKSGLLKDRCVCWGGGTAMEVCS